MPFTFGRALDLEGSPSTVRPTERRSGGLDSFQAASKARPDFTSNPERSRNVADALKVHMHLLAYV